MKVKIKPEDLESKELFRKVRITLETEGELMLFYHFLSQLNDEMTAPFGIPSDPDTIYDAYIKLSKAVRINCITDAGKYENIIEIREV